MGFNDHRRSSGSVDSVESDTFHLQSAYGADFPTVKAILRDHKADAYDDDERSEQLLEEFRECISGLSCVPPLRDNIDIANMAMEHMSRLQQLLRSCGNTHGRNLWKTAMNLECAQDAFLLRFLSAPTEELIELTTTVLSLTRGLGTTQRTVTLVGGRRGKLDIKVSEIGTVGVTVGGLLWDSAIVMSRRLWVGEGPYQTQGRRVLEIGCGACMLPSITASHLGAKEVVWTDYMPEIVDAATRNWESNNSKGRDGDSDSSSQCAGKGALLDWNDIEASVARLDDPDLLRESSFDLVIATDCVYDECQAEPAARALYHFCKKSRSSRALVTFGDRNARVGIELCVQTMLRLGFVIEWCDKTTELTEYVFRMAMDEDGMERRALRRSRMCSG